MRAVLRGLLVLAIVLTAHPALADDREQCLAASSSAQDLRHDNKLIEARAQLLVCARETCPVVVRRDCAEWLSQVESSVPTVVISVRDDKGADIVFAHVAVDGARYLDRIDGTAARINPGVHKILVESDGMNPLEQEVVIRQGEKNRSLVFTVIRRSEPVKPAPAPSPVAPTATNTTNATSHTDSIVVAENDGQTRSSMFTPRRKLAIGLAAVGGVGLIVGAILGTSAQGKHDDAHELCADPQTPCADAATAMSLSDSAHSYAIGADATLLIGAAALVGGGVLWFTGGPVGTQGVAIVPGTRGVAVFGRF